MTRVGRLDGGGVTCYVPGMAKTRNTKRRKPSRTSKRRPAKRAKGRAAKRPAEPLLSPALAGTLRIVPVKFPADVCNAIEARVKAGTAVSTSDFIRQAVRHSLEQYGVKGGTLSRVRLKRRVALEPAKG